jgi:small conductance mechanosensitive channel
MDIEHMQDLLQNPLIKIMVTIGVAFIAQLIVRHFTDRIVRKVVRYHRYANKEEERKREDTLASIFHTLAAVIIWIITIIVVLVQLHVNLAGLATGAGLIGIIVSLGAQGAIKDFLAGLFIIMENQMRVGDIVTIYVAGTSVSGVVEDITIRITKLRDLDGRLHIVPNGSASVITNMTFRFANVNIDIPVSYEADVEKVRDIVNTVGKEMSIDKEWGVHITKPIEFLRVDSFLDSAISVKALGEVVAGMQWDVAGEFRRRILTAFNKADVSIPYPHVVVESAQYAHKSHKHTPASKKK